MTRSMSRGGGRYRSVVTTLSAALPRAEVALQLSSSSVDLTSAELLRWTEPRETRM